jgi:dTDP-4-dehydrorhamnose reductase
MRPRVLLLGSSGQIGRELHPRLALFGTVLAPRSRDLDLERPDDIAPRIRSTSPDFIVNAAAYTAVDDAERDADRARLVNGDAVGVIAETAADLRVPVVHYSTDYVYDGTGDAPRAETDPPNPLNVYGATKLSGDRALLASDAAGVIFRTAWVYGHRPSGFVATILRLAKERPEIRVVDDQFGSPTSAALIARVTALVIRQSIADPGGPLARGAKVVHLTSRGWTSRFGLAGEIVDLARKAGMLDRRPELVAIRSSEYPSAAVRPKNSRLSLDRLRETFGITPPSWREDLASHFRRL